MSQLKYKDSNGEWKIATSYHQVINIGGEGGIVPEGTLPITENGTYDVTNYANAEVNVPTGGGEMEPIVLSGACSYACSGALANVMLQNYADKISTEGITIGSYMFYNSPLERVPFDINFTGLNSSFSNMFEGSMLKEAPVMKNVQPMNSAMGTLFQNCKYLLSIPEGFDATWDWSTVQKSTNTSGTNHFSGCWSLRSVSPTFLNNLTKVGQAQYYSHPYYNMFNFCYNLDSATNISVGHATSVTTNLFRSSFYQNSSLKQMTFETNEDGTPKTANWKAQVIDMSIYVGYFSKSYTGAVSLYDGGRTDATRVVDAASYEEFKNHPDYWTSDINYSRYNKLSAVETINSLPDCSAFGGTNTITFKGESGASTDGGAINTMTDAEIAVATAKGWTVTFA